jgi:hypothetical protein
LVVAAIALALLVSAVTANASPARVGFHVLNHYILFRAPADRPVDLILFLNEEGIVSLRDGRVVASRLSLAVRRSRLERSSATTPI